MYTVCCFVPWLFKSQWLKGEGKAFMNGPFSIPMLKCQRVYFKMAFVCSGEPTKPHEGIINTIEKLVVGRNYCANQPAKMVDLLCSHI